MKYVALLSGGKDSCYNLLHCSKNGHELVAAASLSPERGKEELDSYLYQTVGQDAIEFVARALEVPLYRRVISGAAVDRRSEYGGRRPGDAGGVEGDETEDLFGLLTTVKTRHPDIQGVSIGAILSNYQRVRVEHVCRRLSLTPLCYLWQRDQRELLSEMIEAGMVAILIKVAGVGLTVKHLGNSLADMQTTLVKLHDLYGSHICGEGGEYETLTLDCPLFKRRINLTDVQTVIHSDNGFATVAFLRIKSAILETKPDIQNISLAVPPLLEPEFSIVRGAVLQSQGSTEVTKNHRDSEASHYLEPTIPFVSSKQLGSWVSFSDIQRNVQDGDIGIPIEDEVRECFDILQSRLSKHSLDLSHIANINIFLSSMDLFVAMNAVYSSFFGSSPPARACVAVDLHPPIRFKLDCIAYAERTMTDRQALHVQGLSYWAPANIGPYSQAIVVGERVWISGQIGLIPSCLSLPSPRSLAMETALSFQHVDRVKRAQQSSTGGGWAGHAQLVLYWLCDRGDVLPVQRACESYGTDSAPTLLVVVKALPKDSLIEKQVLLHTGRCNISGDGTDDELLLQHVAPIFAEGNLSDKDCLVHWEASQFDRIGAPSVIICVRGTATNDIIRNLGGASFLQQLRSSILSIRLFLNPSKIPSYSNLLVNILPEYCPITFIPCRFIATRGAGDWDYVLSILGC